MYLSFYGLREKPFGATPDPKFLHLTPGHREALAQLTYGVQEKKGFIVLTGEVGTGKTTLLRALLQRLNEDTAVAFIFNSQLGFEGILEYMLEEFGIGKTAATQAQMLFALNNFLIERRRVGQNAVLILDEAQNLDASTLEHIRLLSNFETPTDKLLPILLVGQPELRVKLNLRELRQLKQRIALSCSLAPLTPRETHAYIRTRLRVAGASSLGLFTDDAIRRIVQHTGGIPRLVNMVCDHCLLIGYADEVRRIDRKIVREAIDYLEDRQQGRRLAGEATRKFSPLARWAIAASVAAAVGAFVFGVIHFQMLDVFGVMSALGLSK